MGIVSAVEVIYESADSEKEFMGLTNWRGELPERTDVEIARNYLNREELEILDQLSCLTLPNEPTIQIP